MEVLNVLALGCYRTVYMYNKTSSYNNKALNQFFEISWLYKANGIANLFCSQKRVEQEDVRLHAVNIPVLSVHVLNSILLTNTGIWITRNKENKMRTHSRSKLYYILKEAGDQELDMTFAPLWDTM